MLFDHVSCQFLYQFLVSPFLLTTRSGRLPRCEGWMRWRGRNGDEGVDSVEEERSCARLCESRREEERGLTGGEEMGSSGSLSTGFTSRHFSLWGGRDGRNGVWGYLYVNAAATQLNNAEIYQTFLTSPPLPNLHSLPIPLYSTTVGIVFFATASKSKPHLHLSDPLLRTIKF